MFLGYIVLQVFCIYVNLRLLACWDCGFESRRGHECLSLVSVVFMSGEDLCVGLINRPKDSY